MRTSFKTKITHLTFGLSTEYMSSFTDKPALSVGT